MAEDAPTGVKRRGFRSWKRWLLALCLLPFVAFGLSNLLLGSPWGRHWLGKKFQNRCGGLPTRIGAASWSPWRGVTLANLEISRPDALDDGAVEPLLRIESLCLMPDWRAGLRRRLVVRSLTLERPRLVLSVEMMARLARQQAAAAGPVTMPPVAMAPVAQPPAIALNQPPAERPPQVPPDMPPPVAPPAPPAPPVQPVPSQPTGWLHLRFASFELVAAHAPWPLMRVDDVNCDIPFSGDAAKSQLRMGDLAIRGHSLITDLAGEITWQPQTRVLTLEPVSTSIHGIALRLSGQLGLLRGLPAVFVVQAPPQVLALPLLPVGIEIAAENAVLNAGVQGFLLAPGSWQGALIADARDLTIKHHEGSTPFQVAHCGTLLRGGMLSCVDARLLSEELSFLGNATLLVDGRLAGVVRLVAPPDRTTGLVKRFFPDLADAPALTPLSTEQRVAFDLSVFGTIQDPQLQLGLDGPIRSAKH